MSLIRSPWDLLAWGLTEVGRALPHSAIVVEDLNYRTGLLLPQQVTFQTPLRDPQTHRILSPSMSSKLEAPFALEDAVGLENSPQNRTQKEK